VADDHPVVREGLRAAARASGDDIEIVAEASNGHEVLEIAEKTAVDVFILDAQMPILNGIQTTARLVRMNPASRVIILGIHDSRMFVERALRAGAKGYALKESSTEEIIQAVREVYRGRSFIGPAVTRQIVDEFIKKAHPAEKGAAFMTLTDREKEVLQLLAEGFAPKAIAERLFLSPSTVRVHKKNIMKKLGLHNQTALVRYAIKEGISKL